MKTFEERIDEWQRALLDLTDRNRLLNFKRSSKHTNSLPITAPNPFEIFGQLVDGKSTIVRGVEISRPEVLDTDNPESRDPSADNLASSEDQRFADDRRLNPGTALAPYPPDRTNRLMLKLRKAALSSLQEQGTNPLFATFGLLEWKLTGRGEGEARLAPLLLLPITIEESIREDAFRISAIDDAELNSTLVEKLKQDFGLELPTEFDTSDPLVLQEIFEIMGGLLSSRAGWKLHEETYVGTFQFHKIRMFKDLQENINLAFAHPIVEALAFDDMTLAAMSGTIPDASSLDYATSPSEMYSVLDADASQLQAISAAIQGSSFVLHGPPGTGKSQTIANIIAEFIARGKRVLFVSEKAPAIEVVHQRLTDAGLSDYTLFLHSHKAQKLQVIHSLGDMLTQLMRDQVSTSGPLESDSELIASRQVLNEYVTAVHQVRAPLNRSLYQVLGELALLQDVPLIAVPPIGSHELNHQRFQEVLTVVGALVANSSILFEEEKHPWYGFVESSLSLAESHLLEERLNAIRENAIAVTANNLKIARILGTSASTSLDETCRRLDFIFTLPLEAHLQEQWFDSRRFHQPQQMLEDIWESANAADRIAKDLLNRYDEQLLSLATDAAINSYERNGLSRFVDKEHRQLRAQVRAFRKTKDEVNSPTELADLRQAQALAQIRTWFLRNCDEFERHFGIRTRAEGQPILAEWVEVREHFSWVERLRSQFPEQLEDAAVVHAICHQTEVTGLRELAHRQRAAVSSLEDNLTTISKFFAPQGSGFGNEHATRFGMLALAENARQLLDRFDEIDQWLATQRSLEAVRSGGFQDILNALLAHAPERWVAMVRKFLLFHWADSALQDPRLLHFSRKQHEETIEGFRQLDRALINRASDRVRYAIESRRRTYSGSGEPGVLTRQYNMRKRHLPLRRLFEKIPNLLLDLKPCLMMSPLSVAQYLPADQFHNFDLVIFDEASQVRPHDAIGAIMRGKQLIVAGDRHQLPPTSFFDYVGEDAAEEDHGLRDFESILDTLKAKGLADSWLRWHYRSRNENLIAFSNLHIYDNQLITFPSASLDSSNGTGVSFSYVENGRYHEVLDIESNATIRANREEARRVASLVMEHVHSDPEKSLGVITFGINQKNVIDEEIDSLRSLDASTQQFFGGEGSEPFFVKPIELVQGDQRDVIIISVGFGKDLKGSLSHNFGPLNRDGGERRLNVMTTRAKERVVVVSSIRSTDIDLTKTQKRGPRLLKSYLDFAEFGPNTLPQAQIRSNAEADSDFEEAVFTALTRSGYEVHKQVGCSGYRIDLGVLDPRNPTQYILGIECDGATYHSAKTARDRDRIRQEILEGLGWNIHRVWSTEWLRSPVKELDRIITRIQQESEKPLRAESKPSIKVTEPERKTPPIIDQVPSRQNVTDRPTLKSPRAAVYVEAMLTAPQTPSLLEIHSSRLREVVREIVEQEGPIHKDLVVIRLARHWRNARAGNRIRAHVESAIMQAISRQDVVRRSDFLWKPGQSDTPVRGKDEFGQTRPIEYVPPEEILGAFKEVLRASMSLSAEELMREGARFLGYERTGRDIKDSLNKVLSDALKNGSITERSNRITLPRV
jgi:very-short-patch-repair endonuclease